MKNRILHIIYKVLLCQMITLAAASCELIPIGMGPSHYDKVMLLYSAGHNSLSYYLKGDIEELKNSPLPSNRDEDVVLVYSHFPDRGYSSPSSPTLIRLRSTKKTPVVVDTLCIYPEGTISASAEQLETVLSQVKEAFPANSYGMIFSSHATGYLPAEYFQNHQEESGSAEWSTFSIGQDKVGTYGDYQSHEIDLPDFAESIPMHLDYVLFDACFMGGIEVAYELKDKVGKVGFSQTEVLADGYCYGTLTSHILRDGEPDLESVCTDFFNQYEIQDGISQSATISLVDCSRLAPLAELCRNLFEKYSEGLDNINSLNVQRFFRDDSHWFYDLESILVNAGINDEELDELHRALDSCVLYKAHTPKFMSEFAINTFSGFSMYLPCKGDEELDTFYKTLKWNKETGLVN